MILKIFAYEEQVAASTAVSYRAQMTDLCAFESGQLAQED